MSVFTKSVKYLSHFGIFIVTLNVNWQVQNVLQSQFSFLAVLLELFVVNKFLAFDLDFPDSEKANHNKERIDNQVY